LAPQHILAWLFLTRQLVVLLAIAAELRRLCKSTQLLPPTEMLEPLELQIYPSSYHCISWSEDGEIAVATGEYVQVLVRTLEKPTMVGIRLILLDRRQNHPPDGEQMATRLFFWPLTGIGLGSGPMFLLSTSGPLCIRNREISFRSE
jgi:hypothetical protein